MAFNRMTVYDIAKEAGVSAATVSRVLTGNVPVNEKTRQRVMEILEKHNFRPSSVARSLKARRSKTIGFIVPDITNPYFSQLFLELEVRAAENGYNVILCNSHSDYGRESQILNVLLEKEVEGIVFTGGRVDSMMLTKKYTHEMERVNRIVPLITCSVMPGAKCIQIINNEQQGVYDLLEHLASLGHRTVGMVGGRLDVRPAFQRRKFLLEAAEEHGITVDNKWLIEGCFSITSGRESMDRLLELDDLPTAVMAVNDVVAVGALGSMQRHGLSIPRDMALTGFDGIQLTEAVTPSITTMVASFAGYAERIIEIVLTQDAAGTAGETVLDLKLSVRESTVSSDMAAREVS
jgi:DNA-binding LacI/PurR family transcriptional regulator